MSVHAGKFFFDERPTDDERRSIVSSVAASAPDGVSVVADRGIVMASGASHAWIGDRDTSRPQRSLQGLVITWDGRLDNRDDFRRQLGARVARDASDAEIALAIFEDRGVEGLRELVGEWSLVVWDAGRRQLYFARDYLGVRPLYLCTDGRSVAWSSLLGELVARTGRADALNERFAVQVMTLQASTDATPYICVRAVPTASCVSFSADGTERCERFWNLDPGRISYADTRAYEEQLRALWADAVGARLRTEGTVWAELSGGLDSSSVVCMAHALIADRRVAAAAIQPLSHVTLQSPGGDERTFIAEVETRIGVKTRVFAAEEHEGVRSPDWEWVTPVAPRGVQVAAEREVSRSGGRVILSGRMGDLIMGCTPDNSVAVFDDFAHWKIATALWNMRRWSLSTRKPFIEIAWNLASAFVDATASREGRMASTEEQRAGMALLSAPLREIAVADQDASGIARLKPSRSRRARLSQRGFAAAVLRYSQSAQLEVRSATPGVTYTYPFAHRPLVEFMAAIPAAELSAPGETRSLMRRSFRGFVPERVLLRTSKGHYPPAMIRAARRTAASLPPVEQLGVVRRGWLDRDRLHAAIRTFVDGGREGGVRGALMLEQWLTSRCRRDAAEIPTRKEVTTHVRIA